jgi:hypothetical protein
MEIILQRFQSKATAPERAPLMYAVNPAEMVERAYGLGMMTTNIWAKVKILNAM